MHAAFSITEVNIDVFFFYNEKTEETDTKMGVTVEK